MRLYSASLFPAAVVPNVKKQASNPDSCDERRREIHQVARDELAQLRMLLPGRGAAYGDDASDGGVEEGFTKDTLPDHAGGAEDHDFHVRGPVF
jgi:hypothetical protein